MGLVNDFLFTYALEADDITGEAQAGARQVAGGPNPAGGPGANANVGDEPDDISKTDDIFGTAGSDDDPINGNTNNAQNLNQNPQNNVNNNDPFGNDSNNMGNNDPNDGGFGDMNNSSMNDGFGENNEQDKSDPPYYDKNKLKNNMLYLYNLTNSSNDAIIELRSKLNDPSSIKVCNMVNSNLTALSDCIYETITDKIANATYQDMLREYISFKRIYDLCTEIMNKHFDNAIKDKKKKK